MRLPVSFLALGVLSSVLAVGSASPVAPAGRDPRPPPRFPGAGRGPGAGFKSIPSPRVDSRPSLANAVHRAGTARVVPGRGGAVDGARGGAGLPAPPGHPGPAPPGGSN